MDTKLRRNPILVNRIRAGMVPQGRVIMAAVAGCPVSWMYCFPRRPHLKVWRRRHDGKMVYKYHLLLLLRCMFKYGAGEVAKHIILDMIVWVKVASIGITELHPDIMSLFYRIVLAKDANTLYRLLCGLYRGPSFRILGPKLQTWMLEASD